MRRRSVQRTQQAIIDVDTRPSVASVSSETASGGNGRAAGSDDTRGATDGRGPMTARPATNPLNDVSAGATAHCYANAGRNRQFVFNMRDAPASWVDVQSLEHRPAVPRLSHGWPPYTVSTCLLLGERQRRSFI